MGGVVGLARFLSWMDSTRGHKDATRAPGAARNRIFPLIWDATGRIRSDPATSPAVRELQAYRPDREGRRVGW